MVVPGVNQVTDWGQDAEGKFHFTFVGEFGRLYVIELSTDLAGWTPVVTNTVDSLGNIHFTDESAVNRATSFYRLTAP